MDKAEVIYRQQMDALYYEVARLASMAPDKRIFTYDCVTLQRYARRESRITRKMMEREPTKSA